MKRAVHCFVLIISFGRKSEGEDVRAKILKLQVQAGLPIALKSGRG